MQPPSRLVTLSIAFASLLLACTPPAAGGAKPPTQNAAEPLPMSDKVYPKPSDEELQKKLTPMQFAVARRNNTEPPFRNDFWDHHEAGLYVDVVSGEPLFASVHKFDSGTGWPSFTQPVEKGRVKELSDSTHGMTRVEVRSKDGDSHLGHVFDDGPGPLGLRYCINSASLRFVPASELQAQGYARFAALFGAGAPAAPVDTAALACGPQEKSGCAATVETAVVAGGCFWGMEELLRQIPGVLETEVGYTGGALESPTYNDVKKGNTGHAEAVRITFDPATISFEALLENWFFRMHDPTTVDRQGNDVGTQYRSAIFFASPEQKATAEKVIARVDASGKWKSKVVTRLQPFTVFTKAEDYHQDYLQKNPGGYTCHWMRD